MPVEKMYLADAEVILSHRHDNGADLWTTPDKRLIKGSPFSTLESSHYLLELGMDPTEEVLQQTAALVFSTWQEDGRFRTTPKGAHHPCHTIQALNALCHLGFGADPKIQKTFRYLLETQEEAGGWRCHKFSYGHGPETAQANPFPTLTALDAFRFAKHSYPEPALDKAVAFLLEHWRTKAPLGPCHYGIGTLFMQVEYPFRTYNLFYYVYVLSFYDTARRDERFLEALSALQSKFQDGQIVVERVVPKLASLSFCQKGQPSALATRRYLEILANVLGEA